MSEFMKAPARGKVERSREYQIIIGGDEMVVIVAGQAQLELSKYRPR
jgi:hypothetical protein